MASKINIYANRIFPQLNFIDRNIFNVINYEFPERVIDTAAEADGLYLMLDMANLNFDTYYYPKNVINARRLNDIDQFYVLKRFDIKMPNIIYSTIPTTMYTMLEQDKDYLVKYFGHARSIGQTIITKNKFISFIHGARDMPRDEFKNRFVFKEGDVRDGEENVLQENVARGHSFLQEYIKFLDEYRFLAFNTRNGIKLIVEKREGYGVLDEKERKHEVCYTSDFRKKNVLFETIGNRLLEVMVYLNLPVMSFDIYINSENDWGCFEFAVEYGVSYEGHYDVLAKYTTDAYLAFATRASLIENS